MRTTAYRPYTSIKFDEAGGTVGMLEVLGTDWQFVAFGLHRKT